VNPPAALIEAAMILQSSRFSVIKPDNFSAENQEFSAISVSQTSVSFNSFNTILSLWTKSARLSGPPHRQFDITTQPSPMEIPRALDRTPFVRQGKSIK